MNGRVVVLGSVNVDLTIATTRLPGPGETVFGSSFTRSHGGKGANQAVAAVRMGVETLLCGAVGSDPLGDGELDALEQEGVNVERVLRSPEPTGVAFILVDPSGENEIVVVPGANEHAQGDKVDWRAGDVALAVLEVPLGSVENFLAEASAAGATTVLNAAPATAEAARLLELARVVCVNEGEMEPLGPDDAGRLPGGPATVVTLGGSGLRLVDDEGLLRLPAHPVRVIDTVGAGDAVCGVLAAGLAEGRPLRESVVRANAAAAMTVQHAGARTSPTADELGAFLESAQQRESER